MNPVWIVLGVIAASLVVRLAAGALDHGRVRAALSKRKAKLLSIRWTPFGPGWLGERTSRIYEVRFLDSDGRTRIANCKTSAWSGVYFTGERFEAAERKDPGGRIAPGPFAESVTAEG